VATLDRGRETLDDGGGGVVKVMQATETFMTAVIGATVCRCGRKTGEGAAAATAVMGRCTVGEEARQGAVGDGGGGEGCGLPTQIREGCDGSRLCGGGRGYSGAEGGDDGVATRWR
jgi:hypothetical protein